MSNQTAILIVDDEPGLAETLKDILQTLGHDVEIANDGLKAIERVKAKPFEIVLMDIRMPGINGVETFKEVKKIRPGTAVMMMTAYSVEALVSEALEEGAFGVLYKPFDVRRVLEFIAKVEEGCLVLVVDDDTAFCETLMDVLKERGSRVAIASNGKEALEVVRENGFDVIFIDVRMPVMNGLETFLAMKEIKPDVRAVMMTGFRREVGDLVEKAISGCAYMCLDKPIDLNVLLDVVEAVAAGRSKAEVQSLVANHGNHCS